MRNAANDESFSSILSFFSNPKRQPQGLHRINAANRVVGTELPPFDGIAAPCRRGIDHNGPSLRQGQCVIVNKIINILCEHLGVINPVSGFDRDCIMPLVPSQRTQVCLLLQVAGDVIGQPHCGPHQRLVS